MLTNFPLINDIESKLYNQNWCYLLFSYNPPPLTEKKSIIITFLHESNGSPLQKFIWNIIFYITVVDIYKSMRGYK